MDWLSGPFPLVLGHRGASADAPENTLAAFELALAQGAQGVELDVRLSSDGRVVVIHDATVDRTTKGAGRVGEMTANDLRALDTGNGAGVPTLDDVFEAFGPRMLYNVELKVSGLSDKGLARAVAESIEAHHLQNHVVVSSFHLPALRGAQRELGAATMTGFLWYKGRRLRPMLQGLLPGVEADHPYFALVDEAYMAWARKRRLRVHVWTVDEAQEARRLAALGVHALITNRPREIIAALAAVPE